MVQCGQDFIIFIAVVETVKKIPPPPKMSI
jgi:hypothetical protein